MKIFFFLTFIFLGSVVLLVWHFCFGLIFSFLNIDEGRISKQGAICNDYSPTAKRILLNNPLNRSEANDDLVMIKHRYFSKVNYFAIMLTKY